MTGATKSTTRIVTSGAHQTTWGGNYNEDAFLVKFFDDDSFPPVANFTASNTNVCAGSTLTFTNTSTGSPDSVRWVLPGGIPSTSTSTTTITPVFNTAGTYTVSLVVYKNGVASSPFTRTITVNSLPTANAGVDKVLTCSTTSVVLNGTSGTSGTTYLWSGPGIVSGGTTLTPTVNTTGTYILTVTITSTGCVKRDTVLVTFNGILPTANAGADKVLTCSTTSVILNGTSGTSGTTYLWSGPGIVSGGTTLTPTVNVAGTYILTVTITSTGCVKRDTVLVTSNITLPTANAGADKVLTCSVTSVVLNGSSSTSGTTYSWSGPGIVSGGTTLTPTVNVAGTYILTVTVTSTGCIKRDTVLVTSNGVLPNANAGTDKVLTCSTTSVVLNGSSSTSGTTYSWSGPGIVSGGTTLTPTVNIAGTYIVTVTITSTGCIKRDTVLVTSNITLPNANAGTDKTLTCSTTSVVLNGSSSTSGTTYSWSGPGIVSGGTTLTPTVNIAGTYIVTVTITSTGCIKRDTVLVTSNITLPNANAGTDKTLTCSTTSVVLNGSSSTSGTTYLWSGPGIVSGGTTLTPTVNVAGTYILTVTITSTGCIKRDTVLVTSNGVLPNANAGTDKILTCSTTSVVLNGSSSTSGTTYSWSGPGIVSGGTTLTPTVNIAGTYILTATITSTGCIKRDTVLVTSNGVLPNANAGTDKTLTCSTTSVVLNGSSSTSGTTYLWSGPGIVSGGTTLTPTVNVAGTYILTVTVTSTGCTKTDTVLVSSNGVLPNANAGTDKTLTCSTTSVVLNGSSSTSGTTYSWSGPGIVSGGTTLTPTVNIAGTYILTVTITSTGCTKTDTVLATIDTIKPNVTVNSPSICSGQTATLTATGADTYSWTTLGTGNPKTTPALTTNATYTVIGTRSSNGCANSAISTVTVNTVPTPIITQIIDTLFSNVGIVGASYEWYKSGMLESTTTTPFLKIAASGIYTLKIINNGCQSVLSATYNAVLTGVKNNKSDFQYSLVPNPTNKGFFEIRISSTTNKIYQLRLYNIAGQTIYSEEMKIKAGQNTKQISVAGFEKGIYFLSLNSNDEVITEKIIIQ